MGITVWFPVSCCFFPENQRIKRECDDSTVDTRILPSLPGITERPSFLECKPMQRLSIVGGWATPLKNMTSSVGNMKFPIWMESHKIPWFQSPPTRLLLDSHQYHPLTTVKITKKTTDCHHYAAYVWQCGIAICTIPMASACLLLGNHPQMGCFCCIGWLSHHKSHHL